MLMLMHHFSDHFRGVTKMVLLIDNQYFRPFCWRQQNGLYSII